MRVGPHLGLTRGWFAMHRRFCLTGGQIAHALGVAQQAGGRREFCHPGETMLAFQKVKLQRLALSLIEHAQLIRVQLLLEPGVGASRIHWGAPFSRQASSSARARDRIV